VKDPGLAGDLAAALFARRIVTMTGELGPELAGDTAAALMTLDALGDDPIELRLDCAKGSIGSAFTVMDTMDVIGVPVYVTCVGTAGEGAVGVLAVGVRRRMGRHARVYLAEPQARFAGTASQIQASFAGHQDELLRFLRRLAEATGRPVEHLEADLQAGRYLDAAGARDYGLVDEVVGSPLN
jgi:ATP-dependent Clp protease, protease subunit